MKKVIVFGKGWLCVKVCENLMWSKNFDLVKVVPVKPEPSWTDSISDWCKENSVEFCESGNYKDVDPSEFDLGISVFYDKIFSADYIDQCDKIINIHNAPLPKYRGVSPINWALKNNESEHGVTIHNIEPGIDSGDIISQLKYSIYPDTEEVIDVYEKSLRYGYILFEQTIEKLYDIKPMKQRESESTYYDKNQDPLLGDRKNFTKKESK